MAKVSKLVSWSSDLRDLEMPTIMYKLFQYKITQAYEPLAADVTRGAAFGHTLGDQAEVWF